VRTRLVQVRGAILRFAYAVHRAADDALLCEGSTTHIAVDRSMKRTTIPARYAELFREHVTSEATEL